MRIGGPLKGKGFYMYFCYTEKAERWGGGEKGIVHGI